jgi:tetratricopeptide (TPR) repeat protein
MSSGRLAVLLLMLVAALQVSEAAVSPQQGNAQSQAPQTVRPPSAAKAAAMEAQRKAEADPSEANLFLYASSLMKVNYPAAETIYRYAVSKYPDSVRLHAGLASALWVQGQRDEGARELCKAAELDPDDPHPLEFLALTGEIPDPLYPQVVAGLDRLRRRYPKDGLILFDYEMVVSKRSDNTSQVPKDFLPTLKEAVRLTPQLPEAYYQMSLVYDDQKDYADEADVLRHAVELSPKDDHYRYHLAMAYKKLGNKEAFKKQLSIVQKTHQQSNPPLP